MRLTPDVHLDQNRQARLARHERSPALERYSGGTLVEFAREFDRVYGVNQSGQCCDRTRLVALQVTNHVPA